ncbi:endonuclease/exonuclease/phosphatase family protein [Phocaeicola plebeius]|uniref:endonuclease/exonuclease/phosphatase family protein n=1 Tax=Phocaeicola plebeius TaxID=310297 RepID=UPI00307A83F9
MKHLFTILLTLFSFYASGYAQKPFKVVFYNLENFFDLENDPDVLDDEFTPEGPKKWTKDKYDKKLSNIEKVFFDIAAINKDYPAVIGVCEIENRNVLEDIVATKKLSPANYRIVHYDSPELRGVDAAFMYRADVLKLEGSKAIRTVIPSLPDFKTRDIVTMWGKIDQEDFFFMVAHWPSRLGGKEASAFRRIAVGNQMRHIADSVRALRPSTKVVMMGDFNDDPTDESISGEKGIGAKIKVKEVTPADYYAPFAALLKAGYGTLAYGDAWNIFDNIVVSGNLINEDKDQLKLKKADNSKFYGHIFKRHYMIQKEGQFKGYPLRTYVGNNFQGGFSDHFPVYIYIGK